MNTCYLMMYLIFDQLSRCKTYIYAIIYMHTDENGRILDVVTLSVTLL